MTLACAERTFVAEMAHSLTSVALDVGEVSWRFVRPVGGPGWSRLGRPSRRLLALLAIGNGGSGFLGVFDDLRENLIGPR